MSYRDQILREDHDMSRRPYPIFTLLVALIYLNWVFLAEFLLAYYQSQLGLILHAVGYIALLIFASLEANREKSIFWIALSQASLIRLLSLTIPITQFPLIYSFAIVGIPLFTVLLLIRHLSSISWRMFGVAFHTGRVQILIGMTGIIFGYIEYSILHPVPLIKTLNWNSILLPAVILLIFTGFLEELIFRGVLQKNAIQSIGGIAILYVALIFAFLHIGYLSFYDLIFVFCVGLFYGLVVHYNGSIIGVSISHGIANIMLYLILPFLLK